MTMMSPEAFDLDQIFDGPENGLERDRPWGRPLLVPTPRLAKNPLVRNPSNRKPRADGKLPYTRASSLGNYVSDHTALEVWRMRSAIKGLGDREDLAAQAAALPPIIGNTRDKAGMTKEERQQDEFTNAELDRLAEEAMIHANRDFKAHWGTAIHGFTDPGPHGPPPERMAADVESFFRATAGWVFHMTEAFVANDIYQAAGTFDHLVSIPWLPELGRMILDKKTGLLHPDQFAVQLPTYARGVPYDTQTDKRMRWPDGIKPNQKWGLIAHIPLGLGRTDMYLVDIAAGHKAALVACQVRAHRSNKTLMKAVDFNGERRQHVADLLAVADCRATMTAIAEEHKPVWDDSLRAVARQRLAELEPVAA
jgi:hypothetical protein